MELAKDASLLRTKSALGEEPGVMQPTFSCFLVGKSPCSKAPAIFYATITVAPSLKKILKANLPPFYYESYLAILFWVSLRFFFSWIGRNILMTG